MSTVIRIAIMVVTLLAMAIGGASGLFAQAEDPEPLNLTLRRNFGYGLGAQMQGTFTYRVSGPDDLVRVEFLLDGQVIGQDSEAPFELGFNTRNYAEGLHQLSAVGYTESDQQLSSNIIGRQFVATNTVTFVVLAVVVLVLAFRLGSYFLARRSTGARDGRVDYGFLGGAICPNCGRPFGVHWWSLRLGLGRFDRCPNCGKWNMVRRASIDVLRAAERSDSLDDGVDVAEAAVRQEESLKQRIEDSRFDKG